MLQVTGHGSECESICFFAALPDVEKHRSLKQSPEPHMRHAEDGELTPNITGEIHVLTRWLPVEMKQVLPKHVCKPCSAPTTVVV